MTDILPLAAEALAQDTHTIHTPSPRRNIAPSTSADNKIRIGSQVHHHSHGIDNDSDASDNEDVRSISSSIIDYRRGPRKQLPPLPDLRFEQSYLASIASARGVWWKIALITLKDQFLFPLLQGLGYNLLVVGWRVWNRRAKFSGAGVGARVRRWWRVVNDWEIPSGRQRVRLVDHNDGSNER